MTEAVTGPIALPATPALKTDSPTMLDWGGTLTPPNGGAVQTLIRLGTRHALDFTLPVIPTEPLGRIWGAKLRLAKLYGALLPFGQDGFSSTVYGTVVVAGDGQGGSVLTVRGATPGSAARIGEAFSLVHSGRRYLHFVAAQAIFDATGAAAIPIFPMLRVIPADGDVCEFGRPMIQGSLSGNQVKWQRQSAPFCDFGTITITEDE